MKSILKAFSAVALTAAIVSPAYAGTEAPAPKDLKKVIEDQGINYVETAQKGITLSGYVDTSYTEQFASKGQYGAATFGGTNSEAVGRSFDVNNNNFNINAVKIALEKALPDKNEWAAGFRIDTMYGQDAKILSGNALSGDGGASSFFLEQALVKFRIPVGNGLDIYAGKFVTFLGYEVIESPANLNFSRSLLFQNAIPLTHTGVYADYKFNDTFEAKFGIVDGWNSSVSPSVTTGTISDGSSFGKALTGQLNITAPGKNANICQSFIFSPEGEPGTTSQKDNGPLVVYDIWGNWNPTFVKDSALTLGFNVDLGYSGASGTPTTLAPVAGVADTTTWYGVALYSSYKFSKVFTLSGRGEYLHEDGAINPFYPSVVPTTSINGSSEPVDAFSLTATATFNIWDNLLTRAEWRTDFLHPNTDTVATNGGGENIQNEISLEAVYSF